MHRSMFNLLVLKAQQVHYLLMIVDSVSLIVDYSLKFIEKIEPSDCLPVISLQHTIGLLDILNVDDLDLNSMSHQVAILLITYVLLLS